MGILWVAGISWTRALDTVKSVLRCVHLQGSGDETGECSSRGMDDPKEDEKKQTMPLKAQTCNVHTILSTHYKLHIVCWRNIPLPQKFGKNGVTVPE